jgi:hypothetical protein
MRVFDVHPGNERDLELLGKSGASVACMFFGAGFER